MSSGTVPASSRTATLLWLALAVPLIAAAWFLSGARGDGASPAQAADAAPARRLELGASDVVRAERRVLVNRLPISGSLMPLVQSSVRSKVAGEVLEVTRREGETVRRGELLVRIDTRSQQAQVASQRAALEKARADLVIARLNFENSQRLFARQFIAQNVLDTARSVHDSALASVKLAEAQLRLAEIGVQDALVHAPYDAVVSRRLAEPGEKVSSDSALLELVDLSRMELQAAAPAAEIPAIRPGQLARVRVDGFGEREFEARLERINPTTEQGSRQILLYLALDNADGALRGGMFAQGELVIEQTAAVLAVPASVVRNEAGIDFVIAVEDGLLVRRPVTLGLLTGDRNLVEVRAGLADGARLLAVKLDTLEPGTAVSLAAEIPADAAASGG